MLEMNCRKFTQTLSKYVLCMHEAELKATENV